MADPDEKRGKKGVSDVYLIVDSRERAVAPFLDAELGDHAYVARQVNTGDYLICRKVAGAEPAILACIERKTHTDFAASFKDSRYDNVQKMRDLRDRTGCQLYFFVEGPAFPSLNRRFARIPFANILSAITKLMVRDNVLVVQTENESHTAKRLADFLRVFASEEPYRPAGARAPAPAAGGGEGPTAGEADDAPLAVPEVLTGRIEQSDADAATNMWARLKGVSVVLGKILTREFSVAELAGKQVGPERIVALRTATGRPINRAAAEGLLAVRAGSAAHAVKLVSGLRGVTPAVAELILASSGGLAGLCAMSSAAVAMIKLPQKSRVIRLGATRAKRIRLTLHYREGPEGPVAPPPEPAGHVLGGRRSPGRARLDRPPADAEPEPEPEPVPAISDAVVEAMLAGAGPGVAGPDAEPAPARLDAAAWQLFSECGF